MRLFFLITLPFMTALFTLTACGDQRGDGTQFIEEGEMQVMELKDTCSCDSLDENTEGLALLNDEVYTGVCRLNYPNTEIKYMTKDFMNGQLHGEVTYFDRAGEVLMEEVYASGEKKQNGEGAPQNCNCMDLEQKLMAGETQERALLDDMPFTGMCEEKYPDSDQTYIEIHYKNGLRHGFTTYFDRKGGTMFMEKYEKGQLIKTINEKNK